MWTIGIAAILIVVMLVIGGIAVAQKKKSDSASSPTEMDKTYDSVQAVINHPTTEEEIRPDQVPDTKSAYPGSAPVGDISIYDKVVNRKIIRMAKTKRFVKALRRGLQPIDEATFNSLLHYDIGGFHFYRWVLRANDNENGNVYIDENRLEGFTFLDILRKKIPVNSIDLVVYGSNAMDKNLDDIRMKESWWNYNTLVIFDPSCMNFSSALASFMEEDFEGIVSADCLLSVLDDIEGTPFDTASIRTSIQNRVDALHTKDVKDEVLLVSDEMKKRGEKITIELHRNPDMMKEDEVDEEGQEEIAHA